MTNAEYGLPEVEDLPPVHVWKRHDISEIYSRVLLGATDTHANIEPTTYLHNQVLQFAIISCVCAHIFLLVCLSKHAVIFSKSGFVHMATPNSLFFGRGILSHVLLEMYFEGRQLRFFLNSDRQLPLPAGHRTVTGQPNRPQQRQQISTVL